MAKRKSTPIATFGGTRTPYATSGHVQRPTTYGKSTGFTGYAAPNPKPLSAPAPAAPAGPVAPPISQSAIAGIAGAYTNYNNTTARLGQLEGELGQTYGFNQQGGFDPTNPYSRAALLKQSFQRTQLGNTNSLAARGQLYSGSLQNAQNFATQGYNQNYNELQRAYQNALSNYEFQKQQAKTGYYNSTSSIAGQAADQGMGYGPIPVI